MEKLSPERAKEILKNQGLDVTLEEAKVILEFLWKLASIVVLQVIENEK